MTVAELHGAHAAAETAVSFDDDGVETALFQEERGGQSGRTAAHDNPPFRFRAPAGACHDRYTGNATRIFVVPHSASACEIAISTSSSALTCAVSVVGNPRSTNCAKFTS